MTLKTPILKKDDPQCEEDSLGNIMNAKIWFEERQEQLKTIVRPGDVEDYEGVLNDLQDIMRTLRPGNLTKQLIDMKAMVVMYLPHKVATEEILEAINDIEKMASRSDSLNRKDIDGKIQDLQEVIKYQYDRIPNNKE